MNYQQRLFIYDRKEIITLGLLITMVSIFAFTLGVHYGKKISPRNGPVQDQDAEVLPVAVVPDQLPNRQEIAEQATGAQLSLEETLKEQLHQEVTTTGIKLDVPRQVDLPKQTKSPLGGATTAGPPQVDKKSPISEKPKGQYTLQIGSYPTLEEAKSHLVALNQSNPPRLPNQSQAVNPMEFKAFLRGTSIKGKGTWYRLYAGEFETRDAAEHMGEKYRSWHIIESFVVSKLDH